jgi:hypothetical protein
MSGTDRVARFPNDPNKTLNCTGDHAHWTTADNTFQVAPGGGAPPFAEDYPRWGVGLSMRFEVTNPGELFFAAFSVDFGIDD